jgi:hypothetical protein
MLTREKLQRGEGELVAENPLIGLRKRASHSEKMVLLLLLLQVQVLNLMERKMFISIRMKCHC